MTLEPAANLGGLVCRVVVQDRVDDLSGGDLALQRIQEADELLVPVTLHIHTRHRAFEHVQGGEQRGGSVALVIVGHRRAAALLKGQARLRPVERLYLAFLVDAEDHGMRRRADIEPDDSMEFVDEGRVPRQLEGSPAMRRQAVSFAGFLHRHDGEPDSFRHRLGGPVCRLVPRWFVGQADEFRHLPIGHRRLARRTGLVLKQAVYAGLSEPFLPTPDSRLRLTRRGDYTIRADTIGGEKNDPRPPRVLLRRVAIADNGLKPAAIGGGDLDGEPFAHAVDSHQSPTKGIPKRTLLFRSIH